MKLKLVAALLALAASPAIAQRSPSPSARPRLVIAISVDQFSADLFAERVVLPRKERKAALAAYLTDYAARLETCCRRAPTQWFNFFDFWRSQ